MNFSVVVFERKSLCTPNYRAYKGFEDFSLNLKVMISNRFATQILKPSVISAPYGGHYCSYIERYRPVMKRLQA